MAEPMGLALGLPLHSAWLCYMKHVGVLEQAGFVTTEKAGRVRTCKLGMHRLMEEAAWIERYHQHWDARFNELTTSLRN